MRWGPQRNIMSQNRVQNPCFVNFVGTSDPAWAEHESGRAVQREGQTGEIEMLRKRK
jgi:hypothetical protein